MINKALSPKKTREDRIQIPVKDDIILFLFKSISFQNQYLSSFLQPYLLVWTRTLLLLATLMLHIIIFTQLLGNFHNIRNLKDCQGQSQIIVGALAFRSGLIQVKVRLALYAQIYQYLRSLPLNCAPKQPSNCLLTIFSLAELIFFAAAIAERSIAA